MLGLWELGALPFWRDEVASVGFAQAPASELLAIVGRDRQVADIPNMATYHLALHFWLNFGEDEARVRLLSLLAGIGSVLVVFVLGRRLAGWVVGGVAAGTFALLPFVIHYSREARGYSMAMLASALLTLLLLLAIDRDRAARAGGAPEGPGGQVDARSAAGWAAYGLVAALGLYAHFFVGLIVAAHIGWLVAMVRPWPDWRALVAAAIPVVAAAAPIPFVVQEFGGAQAWIDPTSLEGGVSSLADLAGSPLLLAVLVPLVGVAVWQRRGEPATWLLLATVVVPIAAALLISLFKPILVARYLVVSLPGLAVLAAMGLIALRRPGVRAVAAAALVIALVASLPVAFADQHQQDWRSAGRWMAGMVEPGDRLIGQNGQTALEYYLARAGAPLMPQPTRVAVELSAPDPARLWVALLGDATSVDNRHLRRSLVARFSVVQEMSFGSKLRIMLLEPRTVASG